VIETPIRVKPGPCNAPPARHRSGGLRGRRPAR
jgi:hypothetical protein